MSLARADIVASLTSKGFQLDQGKRDHDFLFLWYQGRKQPVYTKVSRGTSHKTISVDLLGKMSRQLRVTRKQFNQLVDCSMTGADYIAHLRGLQPSPLPALPKAP